MLSSQNPHAHGIINPPPKSSAFVAYAYLIGAPLIIVFAIVAVAWGLS